MMFAYENALDYWTGFSQGAAAAFAFIAVILTVKLIK